MLSTSLNTGIRRRINPTPPIRTDLIEPKTDYEKKLVEKQNWLLKLHDAYKKKPGFYEEKYTSQYGKDLEYFIAATKNREISDAAYKRLINTVFDSINRLSEPWTQTFDYITTILNRDTALAYVLGGPIPMGMQVLVNTLDTLIKDTQIEQMRTDDTSLEHKLETISKYRAIIQFLPTVLNVATIAAKNPTPRGLASAFAYLTLNQSSKLPGHNDWSRQLANLHERPNDGNIEAAQRLLEQIPRIPLVAHSLTLTGYTPMIGECITECMAILLCLKSFFDSIEKP